MNKTLMVLLLFIHASLSGRILLSEPSYNMTNPEISEAQVFFQSVSLEDRDHFILYYLAKGLEQRLRHDSTQVIQIDCKFDNLVEPENFSVDLLNWTEAEFEMRDGDVARLLSKNVVCLDNGKCIYPHDVGSNCCLF